MEAAKGAESAGALVQKFDLFRLEKYTGCISPLYYGSDGVLIAQKRVSEERAELSARVHLSSAEGYEGCELRFSLLDAAGEEVASTLHDRLVTDVVTLNLAVEHPHLWHGTEDPYLYTAVTVLLKDGVEVDRVEEAIGLRYFTIDREKGLFQNGPFRFHITLRGSYQNGIAALGQFYTRPFHRGVCIGLLLGNLLSVQI